MNPKHLTTLTQIIDFCLNTNWNIIQIKKKSKIFKDKGVGGLRVVPRPQQVTNEHEEIISFAFNQWVKLTSLNNIDNPNESYMKFFQSISNQGLLKIDSNIDNFFTVCIYKAVEGACTVLNLYEEQKEHGTECGSANVDIKEKNNINLSLDDMNNNNNLKNEQPTEFMNNNNGSATAEISDNKDNTINNDSNKNNNGTKKR